MRRFDEALRLEPNYVGALINRGRALAALGRTAEASETIRRVTQVQPGSASAHGYLAQLLHALGRESEAERELEIARRLQAAGSGRK